MRRTKSKLKEKESVFTVDGVKVHFSPAVFRKLLRSFVFGAEIETTFYYEPPIEDFSELPDWVWDEYYQYLEEEQLDEWDYTISDFVEEFYPEFIEPENDKVVEEISEYLRVKPYNDPSCGAEFPTQTYTDIREFYKTVVNVVKIIEENGEDIIGVFDPHVPVGGHFNFSNKLGELHRNDGVYEFLLSFAGIVLYLGGDPRHDDRSEYNAFSKPIDDKFSAIHRKSYAVELRYFDGLTFPVSYTLNAIVNMVLFAFWWSILPGDRDKLSRILKSKGYYYYSKALYNYWTEYDKDWSELRETAIKSYKFLTTILKKVDKYVREEWGISPLKGIRFQWLRGSPAIRINELDDYDKVKYYENQLARVIGFMPLL